LLQAFPGFVFPDDPPQRYNIAPSLQVVALPNDGTGNARMLSWGLIPFWAKDPKIGNKLINARSETLSEKPSFREAFKRRRCLIPADGFYEWRKEPGGARTPMYVRLKSGQAFALAGLWETWQAPDGASRETCTIITTQPNALMADIHNRMPVILPPEGYSDWLSPDPLPPGAAGDLLRPYPAEEMEAYAVSTYVNRPGNEGPTCSQSVDGGQELKLPL
jgi:putative SOS response-associated peptidase YedK